MQKRKTVASIALAAVLLAPCLSFAQTASDEVAVRTYFVDLPVMVSIADCESQFREYNDDGTVLHGGYKDHMIGIFQFAPFHAKTATVLGMDINTVAGNMAYARYLYGESGTVPWADSEWCWGADGGSAPRSQVAADSMRDAKLAMLQEQVTQLAAILNDLVAEHSS